MDAAITIEFNRLVNSDQWDKARVLVREWLVLLKSEQH
jgi:hypothetical protein